MRFLQGWCTSHSSCKANQFCTNYDVVVTLLNSTELANLTANIGNVKVHTELKQTLLLRAPSTSSYTHKHTCTHWQLCIIEIVRAYLYYTSLIYIELFTIFNSWCWFLWANLYHWLTRASRMSHMSQVQYSWSQRIDYVHFFLFMWWRCTLFDVLRLSNRSYSLGSSCVYALFMWALPNTISYMQTNVPMPRYRHHHRRISFAVHVLKWLIFFRTDSCHYFYARMTLRTQTRCHSFLHVSPLVVALLLFFYQATDQ